MTEVIMAYCTEGYMNSKEILEECAEEGWVPLVVFRQEEKIIIPTFRSLEICRGFLKRNFPKEWVKDGVEMSHSDLKLMAEKDWRILQLDFPRKMKDIVSFETEIFHFAIKPEAKLFL